MRETLAWCLDHDVSERLSDSEQEARGLVGKAGSGAKLAWLPASLCEVAMTAVSSCRAAADGLASST